MELKELYQEIILDHGKNPRNKGKCDGDDFYPGAPTISNTFSY